MERDVSSDGGKIIFLHGASSSGKSTIARALQARIDEPFWHISIDHLRDAGILPSARITSGEFKWPEMRAGSDETWDLAEEGLEDAVKAARKRKR